MVGVAVLGLVFGPTRTGPELFLGRQIAAGSRAFRSRKDERLVAFFLRSDHIEMANRMDVQTFYRQLEEMCNENHTRKVAMAQPTDEVFTKRYRGSCVGKDGCNKGNVHYCAECDLCIKCSPGDCCHCGLCDRCCKCNHDCPHCAENKRRDIGDGVRPQPFPNGPQGRDAELIARAAAADAATRLAEREANEAVERSRKGAVKEVAETPADKGGGDVEKTKMERIKEAAKDESVKVAYRVAAKQLVKVIRAPILSLLEKQGADNHLIASASKFLDTEFGIGLLEFVLGCAVPSIPYFSSSDRATLFAEELRVGGASLFLNKGIDEITIFLGPVIREVVKAINAQPALSSNSKPLELPMPLRAAESVLRDASDPIPDREEEEVVFVGQERHEQQAQRVQAKRDA